MSDNLTNFLVDVASDPDRMARFTADPVPEMEEAGLSDAERAALATRDSRRLNQVLGASEKQIIKDLKGKKRPKKKGPPKKKRPARKAPAKRRGGGRSPARKGGSKRGSRKKARR